MKNFILVSSALVCGILAAAASVAMETHLANAFTIVGLILVCISLNSKE